MDSKLSSLAEKIILILEFYTGKKDEDLVYFIGEKALLEGRDLLAEIEERWDDYPAAVEKIKNDAPVSNDVLKQLETDLGGHLMEFKNEPDFINTLETSVRALKPIVEFLEKTRKLKRFTFQEPNLDWKMDVFHEERSTINIDERKEERFVVIGNYNFDGKITLPRGTVMTDKEIRFVVEGPDAEAAAKALSDLIFRQFGHKARVVRAGKPGTGAPGKKVDPALQVAGLKSEDILLAMPASALAVLKVADNFQKKPEAEKFLEGTQQIAQTHPNTEIRIQKPDGTLVHTRGIDADTLVNIFTKAAK